MPTSVHRDLVMLPTSDGRVSALPVFAPVDDLPVVESEDVADVLREGFTRFGSCLVAVICDDVVVGCEAMHENSLWEPVVELRGDPAPSLMPV